MSCVVDRNLASWECFDVSTASTLFWKTVPFLYKAPDREEVREVFTVRILSGVTKNNHNLRVLRIHISTNADLLFLHTLEVTEEDFQGLKHEQGILVDFSHFPEKLITLLEKCMQSANGDFQAELAVSGAESCLRIVETNDFNKLPHVSLKFRPGSDQAVKSFLAFRLSEVEQQAKSLRSELTEANTERERMNEDMKTREENWKDLKEKYESARLEGKAESKRIHLEAEERMAEARESLKLHLEQEKRDVEEKLNAQMETLERRNAELIAENRKLQDERYVLDKKCSETSHQLANAEGRAESLDRDCDELRGVNRKLVTEKQNLQIQLSQAAAEVTTLTEKVSFVEQSLDVQRSRISDLEASKIQLEKHCEELRSTISQNERSGNDKSTELKEAKFVIQKLARDLHTAKEKQCTLRAIISRQEDAVAYQQRQLCNTAEEKSTLDRNVHALQVENTSLKSEMEDTKSKLRESAVQLRENETMIGWLHRQINDSAHTRRHQMPRSFPAKSYSGTMMPESSGMYAVRRTISGNTELASPAVEHAQVPIS